MPTPTQRLGSEAVLGTIALIVPGYRPHRRLALGVLVLVWGAGCDAVSDQVEPAESSTTLAPLVPLTTTAPTTVAPGTTAAVTTAADTTTILTTTTALAPQPVGEWDGARFDFGRIVATGSSDDGRFRTIELDRYSARDASGVLIDAAGFTSEPIVYWWRDEPWENNNPATRQFVLAPNVELLALADDDREAACAEPPPTPAPEPSWTAVDASYLDTPDARDSVAALTYSPTGAVVRVRFSTGC